MKKLNKLKLSESVVQLNLLEMKMVLGGKYDCGEGFLYECTCSGGNKGQWTHCFSTVAEAEDDGAQFCTGTVKCVYA